MQVVQLNILQTDVQLQWLLLDLNHFIYQMGAYFYEELPPFIYVNHMP